MLWNPQGPFPCQVSALSCTLGQEHKTTLEREYLFYFHAHTSTRARKKGNTRWRCIGSISLSATSVAFQCSFQLLDREGMKPLLWKTQRDMDRAAALLPFTGVAGTVK